MEINKENASSYFSTKNRTPQNLGQKKFKKTKFKEKLCLLHFWLN